MASKKNQHPLPHHSLFSTYRYTYSHRRKVLNFKECRWTHSGVNSNRQKWILCPSPSSIGLTTEYTEWRSPISGVHPIMMEKSAGEGGGVHGARTPAPFQPITITYKVAVYAPAERVDTLPLFHLYPIYTVRPARMRSSVPLLEPGPPRFFWWYKNSE